MKSGMKNLQESGCSGPISSEKAQKRIDDYCDGLKKAHPEDWQSIDLDEAVLYNASGGMPHGRLSIATGAIKKADVISAAKATKLKPSSSVAYRNIIQENQQLRHSNQILTKRTEMHEQMIRMLFSELGKDLPEWFQQFRTQAHTQGNTDPSNVNLEDPTMDDLAGNGNSGVGNDGENIGDNSNEFDYNHEDDACGGESH